MKNDKKTEVPQYGTRLEWALHLRGGSFKIIPIQGGAKKPVDRRDDDLNLVCHEGETRTFPFVPPQGDITYYDRDLALLRATYGPTYQPLSMLGHEGARPQCVSMGEAQWN